MPAATEKYFHLHYINSTGTWYDNTLVPESRMTDAMGDLSRAGYIVTRITN